MDGIVAGRERGEDDGVLGIRRERKRADAGRGLLDGGHLGGTGRGIATLITPIVIGQDRHPGRVVDFEHGVVERASHIQVERRSVE